MDKFIEKDSLKQSELEYLEAKAAGKIRLEKEYGNLTIIELTNHRSGVKKENEFIVPFGKYEWIEGFDHGLSRVRTHGSVEYNTVAIYDGNWYTEAEYRIKHPEEYPKWGIINEAGEEVLPTEYDSIWKFYGKNYLYTKVSKNGIESKIYFHDLNPSIPMPASNKKKLSTNYCYDDYFNINECYDDEGNFDFDRLEGAILDGEYVPEDWC